MKHHLLIKILALQFLFICSVHTQTSNGIVGKTDDRIITEEEFLERYEFTPGFGREKSGSNESVKLEFLYTLLAEKFWAIEASAMSMDTLEVMKFSKNAFERLFVLDELYRREILNKVVINEDEILDGIQKYNSVLYLNYLISEDEEEIWQLYKYLNDGIPFDSILAESPELIERKEPVKIVYGQMEEMIEDSLFKLNVNEYTSPVLTPDGWYIFRLKNRSEQLSGIVISDDSRKSVQKIISARKEKELYWQFKLNFLKDKSVSVDPVLFESLVNKLSFTLNRKQVREQIKAGDPVYLLSDEVLQVEDEFGPETLSKEFILFEENPVSLKEFIRTLAFNGFSTTDCLLNYMRGLVDNKTKEAIEHELIYREGTKKNLHIDPEVQRQVGMWNDNYLFQVLQEKFLDSATVTELELNTYYSSIHKEKGYPALIKIFQLTSKHSELLNGIKPLLNSAESISELQSKFSDTENDSIQIIESGPLPLNQFGKIGEIALTMEVNDVYGPVEIDEQYVIFKLIEKVDSKTILPVPLEMVEDNLMRDLLKSKVKQKIDNFTVSLAIKYGMSIDLELLDSIEVTSFSSFGIRHLGFGGKITAVPLIAPNFNWVKTYIETVNKVQP